MSYSIDRSFAGTGMEEIETRIRTALGTHGFGVMTEIDVKATMKAKLGLEVSGYRILGACNPTMAHKAMEAEPRVGVMLPCNVILREVAGGVEVSAVDPVASMQAIDNPALKKVLEQVREAMTRIVAEI